MGFLSNVFGNSKNSSEPENKGGKVASEPVEVTAHVCPNCGHKSNEAGNCPNCGVPLRKEGESIVNNAGGTGRMAAKEDNIPAAPKPDGQPMPQAPPQAVPEPKMPPQPPKPSMPPQPGPQPEPQPMPAKPAPAPGMEPPKAPMPETPKVPGATPPPGSEPQNPASSM